MSTSAASGGPASDVEMKGLLGDGSPLLKSTSNQSRIDVLGVNVVNDDHLGTFTPLYVCVFFIILTGRESSQNNLFISAVLVVLVLLCFYQSAPDTLNIIWRKSINFIFLVLPIDMHVTNRPMCMVVVNYN